MNKIVRTKIKPDPPGHDESLPGPSQVRDRQNPPLLPGQPDGPEAHGGALAPADPEGGGEEAQAPRQGVVRGPARPPRAEERLSSRATLLLH